MTSQMLIVTTSSLAVSAAIFLLIWIASVLKKDASIVDISWGPACALPAIVTYSIVGTGHPQQILLVALVVLWALRLAVFLGKRNLPHGEDYRYVRMRHKAGGDRAFAIKSLWSVFGFQCLLSWFVSLPVQIGLIGLEGDSIHGLALGGAAIWLIGICFEAIGDFQLTRFKKDEANKGKLMTSGLWAWTRHPNYFGDAMVWSGLTLIALDAPYGIYTILSPVVMIVLLVKVSGKALTEYHMNRKYPEYAAYKVATSGFIPMPPKSQMGTSKREQ